MTSLLKTTLVAALALLAGQAAQASPLTLSYDLTDLGGSYRYDFTLTADNADGSFFAGNTFDWFIIGDRLAGASPFPEGQTFFVSLPAGWAATTSFGGHNGPTLAAVDGSVVGALWAPVLGESVSFSGISTYLFAENTLNWTHLVGSGIGRMDLHTARQDRVNPLVSGDVAPAPVPLPAGLPLLLGALAPLALLRRRKA